MTVYTAAEITDGDVVMLPKALYDEWIAANDAALDWADANARAFPIETAPTTGEWFLVYDAGLGEWFVHQPKPFDGLPNKRYTHWTPLPRPPSNPPLPGPLERLSEVLQKVKGLE